MKRTVIAICLRDMQVGGVESVLIQTLAAMLARNDVDIRVITYTNISVPQYRDWFAQHPEIKLTALYPCRFLGTQMPHFFLWRIIKHVARDIYRWYKYITMSSRRFDDVDVFIDYYNFSFAREFKKFRGRKITWWHSSIDALYAQRRMRYMHGYDKLVMLTRDAATELRERYPEYAGQIVQIYNPIDIARARDLAAQGKFIRGDYFVCVARLTGDKDIETVLRGFDMFWQNAGRPNIKMVFVGDGNLSDEYKRIAHSLPASRQFEFVGLSKNPFGYMAHARANILSSYSEGMGVVLVEAAATHTLNIASDCRNGPREILMDGRAGLLFVAGDATDLALRMMDAWTRRVDTKKMIDTATKNLNRFDATTITEQIMKVIK